MTATVFTEDQMSTLSDLVRDELVIRRFQPKTVDSFPDVPGMVRGVFVDVETTGLDPVTDKIIQLALVPFFFMPDGQVLAVGKAAVRPEDPGVSIPAEIERLTGITDDDVAGKKIDDAEIRALVHGVGLVVAHNAEFDRQFLEKRFAIFETLFFGCSMRDVPWQDEGLTGLKLEWLAFQHCRLYYDAHRADLDCHMGIHLLSTELPLSGRRALSFLLDAARTTWIRVYAVNAPYDTRHVLKARGYKWSDGTDGRPKAWFKDIAEINEGAERSWLTEHVWASPTGTRFGARLRFSNRIG